jgi:hypothetical protein
MSSERQKMLKNILVLLVLLIGFTIGSYQLLHGIEIPDSYDIAFRYIVSLPIAFIVIYGLTKMIKGARYGFAMVCLLALFGVELLLAFALSATWVKDVPWLLAVAENIRTLAPVVGNFPSARYPEGTSVFLAITLCLLPLKVLFIYIFACSFPEEDPDNAKVWLIVVLILFSIGTLYLVLTFDEAFRATSPRALPAGPTEIKQGGFLLWFAWSFVLLGVTAIFISGSILLARIRILSFFDKKED